MDFQEEEDLAAEVAEASADSEVAGLVAAAQEAAGNQTDKSEIKSGKLKRFINTQRSQRKHRDPQRIFSVLLCETPVDLCVKDFTCDKL